MSKGGLLHYFPAKTAYRGFGGPMRRALAGRSTRRIRAHGPARPHGPRPLSHIANAREWTEQCQQSSCAAFAALARIPG